jgi:hypothetical protein
VFSEMLNSENTWLMPGSEGVGGSRAECRLWKEAISLGSLTGLGKTGYFLRLQF